jgi:hypothetical protein
MTHQPKVLRVHVWPGGSGSAAALVRYGAREFAVRDCGWCQSVHTTYAEALAAFNAFIAKE